LSAVAKNAVGTRGGVGKRQDQGLNYYVFHRDTLPKTQPRYLTKVDQIPPEVVDKLIDMYQKDRLTLMQIAEKMGMEWWTVKEVFKKHGIERISLTERAKMKRAKDFDLIYRLHFVEEVSVQEIYQKYGFSPPYVRSVLKEGPETYKSRSVPIKMKQDKSGS